MVQHVCKTYSSFRDLVQIEDDIPSAKQAFCLCWVWLTLATLWIMLVLTSIVVGVTLGIILNR